MNFYTLFNPVRKKRGRLFKVLLVMKLVIIFITVACLQVSARVLAQKVTLNEKDAPLEKVFNDIKKQTGYIFFYEKNTLDGTSKVSIDVKNADLRDVLKLCFTNQPLAYTIAGTTIGVKKKEVSVVQPQAAQVPIDITGQVLTADHVPLPGATVKIKGTRLSATTDSGGKFKLSTSLQEGTLLISFIGYKTRGVAFNSNVHLQLSIVLEKSQSALNEVVVIGYGETSRRFNTGSVSTVSSVDIEKQPVSNPLAALQGMAPGVLVQTQNGLPGGNITVQVRGRGSLASGTDPLFIIDGVPFLSAPVYGNGISSGANGAISPFSIINPADIASISVLKDADATAIYGSRGANGVVLITTKRGKAGQDDLTVDVSQGFSTVGRLNSYLNLKQYLQLREQAFKNDQVAPDVNSAPDLLVWDTTKSTNWQKYFYGGTANVTNLQASLTGGDTFTNYLLGLNYRNEGTILPGNENYKKGGGYFNFSHTAKDRRFSITLGANYNKDDNHTVYQSINNGAGMIPPDFPIYNPDGTFNWTISNPVAALGQKQNSQSSYLNLNSVLNYKLSPALNLKMNLGYNTYSLQQVATLPLSSQDPSFSPVAVAFFADNSSDRVIIEPTLDYNKHFDDGTLTVLLGGTYQNVTNQGSFIEGDGVNNPDLLGNLGAANSIVAESNTYTQYRYESVFGRLNYNWKQKYILDVNGRRDGSSRFGPGKQFGNFYAFAGAWLFSEEKFVKDNLKFLSYGKLRSSYGLTGNDQIADYQYLPTYRSAGIYGSVSTLSPARLANPAYGWETTKKFELALELGFLNDRVLFTSAWYRNLSSNQLIAYALPYITGFSSYQANFPAVIQNTGLELELQAKVLTGTGLNWNTSLNLTIPKNKLLSFPGLASSSYANTYVVGQDLSIAKSFKFTGVNPQTGQAEFKDFNNDGVISFPADVIVAGKTSPYFFGGFDNEFSYKGFQLSILLEFVKRDYRGYTPALGSSATNDPVFVLNRWQKPGDITNIPAATINSGNLANYYLSQFSDASYIRFKNLSVSYNLKTSLLKPLHFKSLRIFVQGENLFVIANQNRFDPEISNTGAFPPLKTLTAGFKLTL